MRIFLCFFLILNLFHLGHTINSVAQEKDVIFRNIDVTGKNGRYMIIGDVKGEVEEIFYRVEDGHNEYTSEHAVELPKGANWRSFRIPVSIPNEKLPPQGSVILYLYGDDENKPSNPFPVLLESF